MKKKKANAETCKTQPLTTDDVFAPMACMTRYHAAVDIWLFFSTECDANSPLWGPIRRSPFDNNAYYRKFVFRDEFWLSGVCR